jgi:hypothetical protein
MLRREGSRPLVASRRHGADLRIDAEDHRSLIAGLRAEDIVIDAAGPFQIRSTAVVETCIAVGCDVIDLSDSFDYARRLQPLAPRIDAAGIRVMTSCSSVSAVTAALIRLSGVTTPVRVAAVLAPATANTSTRATGQSLLSTLARPIRIRRAGTIVETRAFCEERALAFPAPVGIVHGRLAESPDAILLPAVWPTLLDVDFWIDTRRRLLNRLFAAAARHGSLLHAVRFAQPVGRRLTKYFGMRSGAFGIEVHDADRVRATLGFVHPHHSYVVAVAPAVLAARAIEAGRFPASGFVPPARQVDPHELVSWLARDGIKSFGIR